MLYRLYSMRFTSILYFHTKNDGDEQCQLGSTQPVVVSKRGVRENKVKFVN